MSKIKKEDKVLILSGNHKGNEGIVSKIYPKKNKVFIRGINMIKRHSKPSVKNPKGGIIEKEAPIHISNLRKKKDDVSI
ncbi:50S ribosomal protein L24 [Blattabacterium sp. (Blattella germanica) str. Bge]|uniref:50S ribosomal protein L24 n=1 Tax=Blattabacterium sp. (Blattella germanica) TaxID=624186 RepID=UPI0001BB6143|nr:50S ribosomal protein L24 [Blattabacterium sp. (Blattella germanica)]ACY40269.1 50S ribosomal protein L24 [Blattabacterium sp. (Blattella germanica) str. Bge]